MPIIKLNISGKIFETTKETLQKSRMLNTLVNGSFKESQEDIIFIDRNPEIFDYILNWLRGYPINVMSFDENLQNMILCDMDYYDVDGFLDRVPSPNYNEVSNKEIPEFMQTVFKQELIYVPKKPLVYNGISGKIMVDMGLGTYIRIENDQFLKHCNDICVKFNDKYEPKICSINVENLWIKLCEDTPIAEHKYGYIIGYDSFKNIKVESGDSKTVDIRLSAIRITDSPRLIFKVVTIY